jgi:hypothetical protein
VINRFDEDGILLNGTSNRVEGNFIGTNASGTADRDNGESAVFLAAVMESVARPARGRSCGAAVRLPGDGVG